MKKRNLLFLPLAILLLTCANGCKRDNPKNDSSSSSQAILSVSILSPEKAFNEAGEKLYDMYKDSINSNVYDYFEMTKKFYIFDNVRIDVTWTLSFIKGEGEGIKLINSKDRDNYQGVYVGYYDNIIKEDTEFELIPTLDYKGTTRKLSDIIGQDKKITYKVEKLSLSTFDEYKALCKEAGALSDNKKRTCLINASVLSVSLDGKNIFLHDENNNGILALDTEYSKNDFFSGDNVSLIGNVYYDNGSYFFYNPKITLISKSSPSYEKPSYQDVSEIFKNKESFNDEIEKYQNTRVIVNNVILDSRENGHYYFMVNNNKYDVLSSNTYFLNEYENKMLFDSFEIGKETNIKGILKCIDGTYYIIPDAIDSF